MGWHTSGSKRNNPLKVERENRICKCGCGEEFECKINSDQTFIHGHNRRKPKIEVPEKIKENRTIIKECKCGCGKIFSSFKSHKREFIDQKHYWDWKKGRPNGRALPKAFSTRTCRREGCNKQFRSSLKNPKNFCSSSCVAKWMGAKNKGRESSFKGKSYTEIYGERADAQVKKRLASSNNSPNYPETLLQRILNDLFADEYIFVGNGQEVIDGKCPDFINKDKTKIIELFGDYWHSEEVQGLPEEEHEEERLNFFQSRGYDALVIWEHEVYETDLAEKITQFNFKGNL